MHLDKTDIIFNTFEDWVNTAQFVLGSKEERLKERLVCIDEWCMKCSCGADFHKARDRNSFPVRVYKIVANDETNNAILTEKEIEYLEHLSEIIFGNELLPYKGAVRFSEFVESLRNRKE
jgi:hypothetical protein